MNDKEFLKTAFLKLLDEIKPQKLLKNSCNFDKKILNIQNSAYDLSRYKNIYLFGSGKAVLPMAQSMQEILEDSIYKSFLIGAFEDDLHLKNTIYIQSSHPIPSQKSIESAKKLKKKMQELGSDDFFIYLLSGGTSSLIELPQDGICLKDISILTDLMLKSAMPIKKMNCIRKQISKIKGGKLIQNIKADGIVLLLSDVLGDDLKTIGSAPLYPDNNTSSEAVSYLKKYKIFDKIPNSVKNYLLNAKNDYIKEKIKEPKHFILGSNQIVLQKAKKILQKNIDTMIVKEPLKEEVSIEAKKLLNFVKSKSKKRVCYLFGGECTVNVKKNGYGGRNQHLALSFLEKFDCDFRVTLLCGATDGIDGNSDAAGAVVQATKQQEPEISEIKEHLKNFNSNLYFKKREDLLKTGPTHNNLLDITMIIVK